MNNHQPKGSMCAACKFSTCDCSKLQFDKMPVLKKYPDGTKAVKCTEFQHESKLGRIVNHGN